MKKCAWCGREYPDDVQTCPIDQSPLDSGGPASTPAASSFEKAEIECPGTELVTETTGAPESSDPDGHETDSDDADQDEFQPFGTYDAFEADKLLKKFVDARLRFQIDRVEHRTAASRGMRMQSSIEIFVHRDDREAATKIFMADLKV
jgi:hypothetical protein